MEGGLSKIAIVATTCPRCGSIDVSLVGGVSDAGVLGPVSYSRVISLVSRMVVHQHLIELPGFTSSTANDSMLTISRRSGSPEIEGVGWD